MSLDFKHIHFISFSKRLTGLGGLNLSTQVNNRKIYVFAAKSFVKISSISYSPSLLDDIIYIK
jgi:hypothetical protein